MTRILWMLFQGTVFVVPMYWLATDGETLKHEPGMILAVPAMLWLILTMMTEGLTRLYDWGRFSLSPALSRRFFRDVGEPQRQTDRLGGPRRDVRQLP